MPEHQVYHVMPVKEESVIDTCAVLFSAFPLHSTRTVGQPVNLDCALQRVVTLGHMCGLANVFPAVDSSFGEHTAINAVMQFSLPLRREATRPQPGFPQPGFPQSGFPQPVHVQHPGTWGRPEPPRRKMPRDRRLLHFPSPAALRTVSSSSSLGSGMESDYDKVGYEIGIFED
jgi:hypothetical protein